MESHFAAERRACLERSQLRGKAEEPREGEPQVPGIFRPLYWVVLKKLSLLWGFRLLEQIGSLIA